MSIYLHDWAEGGEEAMLSEFGVEKSVLDGAKIIVASYTYEDYSGSAYVLFERDGKLFEVHGSHCSCHGLSEDSYNGGPTQWQPEEADEGVIRHRLINGTWGEEDRIKDAVIAALSAREASS